jgi:N-acetylglucosamine-6-sulfatase
VTNVLLILADDMRADLLPFMPFVNGVLRREGTQLTNMRCSVPVCSPARAGLLTGQYARRQSNGVYQNNSSIAAPATDSLPVWLSSRTAANGMFGKYLLWTDRRVAQPGWDTWGVLSSQEQDAYGYEIADGETAQVPADHQLPHVAAAVSRFITTTEEPWFCYYAPTNPHVADNKPPSSTQPASVNNPLPSSITKFGWLRWPFVLLDDPSSKPSWIQARNQFTTQELSAMRHSIRQQAREVHDLDAVVAGLCADLAAADRLENTLIVFASDGGVFFGEQRLGGSGTATKDQPYDAVARVPCVLRGPGVPAGEVTDAVAVLQDITATICAVLGATPTVPPDGQDLREVIAKPDRDRATLYERAESSRFPDGVGIVTRDRKLLRWHGQTGDDEYEAYDLDTDPHELVSWANDPNRASERAELDARLDELLD